MIIRCARPEYEHPLYREFRAEAPRVGSRVRTPEGDGVVVGHSVPADSVTVRLDDGRRCGCSRASVCGPRQAYERAHGSSGAPEGEAQ